MKYCAITPSRGSGRRIFLEWQKQRVQDMGYDKHIIINWEPKSDAVDIYERLVDGVGKALLAGMDYCSIIEDDDWYNLSYLSAIKDRTNNENIIGFNTTRYFHLFSTGVKYMVHPGRSSLFCTTFKTSLFDQLPAVTNTPFIDLAWWKFVNSNNITYKLINEEFAIGIKHGSVFGRTGGNGHFMSYPRFDLKLTMLKQLMDDEAFKFYKEVKETYQAQWEQTQRR
jgi:hypothetical protein